MGRRRGETMKLPVRAVEHAKRSNDLYHLVDADGATIADYVYPEHIHRLVDAINGTDRPITLRYGSEELGEWNGPLPIPGHDSYLFCDHGGFANLRFKIKGIEYHDDCTIVSVYPATDANTAKEMEENE
jgi:hypothetical protein